MPYLHTGETLRSRLDELLSDARATQNESAKRSFLDEASVVAMLLRADEDAAFHAASLGDELAAPLPHWLEEEVTGEATGEPLYTEQDVIDALHPLLEQLLTDDEAAVTNHLHDFTRRSNQAAEEKADAVRVYPFHDDPRIDDSIVYGAAGAEATPHLPAEQMPATDPDPATEFEFDTSEKEKVLAEARSLIPLEEEDNLDEDFAPQAPKAPADGFKKLQTKTKGKASK